MSLAFSLATMAFALAAWIYWLGGLAWLLEVSPVECRYRTIGGRESTIPLSHISSMTVAQFGLLTHVHIKFRPQTFWSLRRAHLVLPVRGPFMSNQGPLNTLLRSVDPSIVHQPIP
jgi:hypothetical protein